MKIKERKEQLEKERDFLIADAQRYLKGDRADLAIKALGYAQKIRKEIVKLTKQENFEG